VLSERPARDQIVDVLVRYATAIDTRDWPLLMTCFTYDVHADYGDGVGQWNDAASITEYMRETHRDMHDTKHMLSNFVIEVDGDAASASTYVHAVQVVTEDPLLWYDCVGRYADRLVREGGEWRIAERTYHATRVISSHPLPP
jgi:3-phenylpropionate/cinnamic acid dioxygenase small subunit